MRTMVTNPLTRRFFWDVDPTHLDLSSHAVFIIERILEEGDATAIDWLKQTYPRAAIQAVLRTSRRLSPKTANFFATEFAVPMKEIRCLKPSYRQPHARRWPR